MQMYTKHNHTSMTKILTRYIHRLYLKEKKNGDLQNYK